VLTYSYSFWFYEDHLKILESTYSVPKPAMDITKQSNFTFLPLGAIIQEFRVNGHNIVQNFATAELYKKYNDPYFGETIGRVANRISGAKIDDLNGRSWPLAANNGPNSLHGGLEGWGKKVFEGPIPMSRNGKEAAMFKYTSADGEEGYPGAVELRVWYMSSAEENAGLRQTVLEVEYEAEMVGNEDDIEETAVAVTNHRFVCHSYCAAWALTRHCAKLLQPH